MNNAASEPQKHDLGYAAAVIALALGMVAAAALLYYLVDILLILFLGVVVAAALQPAHARLARIGMPKGLAVLLIYLLFIAIIVLIGLFVGPSLFAQLGAFATQIPGQYTNLVAQLQASPSPLWQRLGGNLPPFAVLTQNFTSLSPSFFGDLLTFMTSTVSFFTYFVVVLAIGFYWTMEVPHLERLVVSLLPVARRPQVLAMWREIEYKLGAFVRAQGFAMLVIGGASALGYFFIGLPNVLVLAVIAGLLEIVPLVGPIATAALVMLVALPQGGTTVLLVLGFSTLLQQFESNVLIPRIMSRTVGISDLVGLFAILAFGALYGVLGVFVAIPLTVIIQVLLERMVISPEPAPESAAATLNPVTTALQSRIEALRQRMRLRLRERDSRMGGNPRTADHTADVLDQRIEHAVEQVETILASAQENIPEISTDERQAIMEEIQQATRQLEHAVQRMDHVLPPSQDKEQAAVVISKPMLERLQRTTQHVEQAVQRAAGMLNEAREESEEQKPPSPNGDASAQQAPGE